MESNVWLIASAWMALALAASLISIRVGISVALIEILIGVLAGNFLGIHTTPWIDFLATFGSRLLTFLAGAEIDPDSLRRHLKPAAAIGRGCDLVALGHTGHSRLHHLFLGSTADRVVERAHCAVLVVR